MNEVNDRYVQIEVPDEFNQILTDGVHEIELRRGAFASDGYFESYFIGRTFHAANDVQTVKVLDIWRDENSARIKVLIVQDPIPVAALIAILVTAGVIAALFNWSVSAVRKLADATSTPEIIGTNPDGTPILGKRTIFDTLTDAFQGAGKLILLGLGVFLVWRFAAGRK